MSDTTESLGLLWGCRAIAHYLNASEKKTYYLLEKRLLDADKTGDIWVTSRSRLANQFATPRVERPPPEISPPNLAPPASAPAAAGSGCADLIEKVTAGELDVGRALKLARRRGRP